ncbi:MAG: hypothetical protein INH41_30000 [Myxococcaceae bacterium]|jgi:hypothetical protein|nr:hypothetical protein [Myxococcaceae bacterium]MCA3016638.1 hypothetical protein [Myxococcaceae bacterium]
MSALAGVLLVHALGSVLRATVGRERLRDALRSPASALVALGVLYAAALGLVGVVLGTALLLCVRLSPRPPSQRSERLPWLALAALTGVVLARPWAPVSWDEFVWLGKARLEALGFGAGVQAALDASQRLIPAGYPPLWPLAVGWVSLGVDDVAAHVVASGLLLVVCGAAALEAWWPRLEAAFAAKVVTAAVLLASPIVLVHVRSAYVDLPVGLLGLALLGFLVTERLPLACAAAVVLSAVKDEGLAHVAAATLAAGAVRGWGRQALSLASPALLAVIAAVTWRWSLHAHGVTASDHALSAPAWSWVPTFARLLGVHALDVWTWGVFWVAVLVLGVQGRARPEARGLRWALLANVALMGAALVVGPERVRVFAESGTLVNRLLVQLWPTAALVAWFGLSVPRPSRG